MVTSRRSLISLISFLVLILATTFGVVVSEDIARDFRVNAETHEFQAEVSRLMDIIVHSLYSNKDIFLRELISNSADALDKIRFLSLTDSSALGKETLPFEIKLKVDKENRVLSLRDTGIGMSKDDLVNNLGTIAKSGTAAFLEQMQKDSADLNLIGQFGVGFYSVYLVADYVEVVTKQAGGTQWVWESSASGKYGISEDTDGEDIGRGTEIRVHIKEDAMEYLEEAKIKELVKTYSEFIDFPIYLCTEKEVEKEVPVDDLDADESDSSDEDKDGSKGSVDVEEEEEPAEKEPKTKTVKETVQEWEVLNDSKALWLRSPSNVSEEEHEGFYKVLSKNPYDTPMAHSHFSAEGDVDFKAVLYLPNLLSSDFYENFQSKKASLKLYVRRVFISDSFEDLVPKWLSFLVGLVDSDSLPLNVSREMLQMSEGIKVIRKKIVRKAIEMMKKLSDADLRARKGPEEDETEDEWLSKLQPGADISEDKEKVINEAKANATSKYDTFWKTYGKAIKMGLIEDQSNRRRIIPLLRFETSTTDGNMTTLDEYVSRMKENQTGIYYLVGTSGIEELKRSPFVEMLVSKGYEVIFFTDPLDEYVTAHVTEYEGKTLINVSKDDLKLPENDEQEEKEKNKRASAYYKGLGAWWKKNVKDLSSVRVSRRLSTTPCVVVSGKYGWSATMERIARVQALGDSDKASMMKSQRILEINPKHPLIQKIREEWEEHPNDEDLIANSRLLYESCLLNSGFLLDDFRSHNERILSLLGADMDIDDMSPTQELDYPEVSKKEEKETMTVPPGDDPQLEELLRQAKERAGEDSSSSHDEL
jgi:heat shock protein 90kDa beta